MAAIDSIEARRKELQSLLRGFAIDPNLNRSSGVGVEKEIIEFSAV